MKNTNYQCARLHLKIKKHEGYLTGNRDILKESGYSLLKKIESQFTDNFKVNNVSLPIKYSCFYLNKDHIGFIIWYDTNFTQRGNTLYKLVQPIKDEFKVEINIYQYKFVEFVELILHTFCFCTVFGIGNSYKEFIEEEEKTLFLKKFL